MAGMCLEINGEISDQIDWDFSTPAEFAQGFVSQDKSEEMCRVRRLALYGQSK